LNYVIEIATADLETTRSAVNGGADRIELCASLHEGGTTPSFGTIRRCRDLFPVSLFPIIRARGGDFFYSNDEHDAMLADARLCREFGCDGIVTGFLLSDGRIDRERIEAMVEAVYPLEVTFHRAFDRCRDPFKALEILIEAGCQRILTSGQQPAAPDGVDLIASLVAAADGRIVIMPGSGVRPDNVRLLAEKTAAVEFHSSLRGRRTSTMEFRHPAFGESDLYNPAIAADDVRALRDALKRL
jgi:copper homeostasis protein